MEGGKKKKRRSSVFAGGGMCEDGTRLFHYDMNFLITKAFAVISPL